jgi:hypothetical protein
MPRIAAITKRLLAKPSSLDFVGGETFRADLMNSLTAEGLGSVVPTFVRTGNLSTYRLPSGEMQREAVANTPRWEDGSLLVEEESQNKALFSDAFNSSWVTYEATVLPRAVTWPIFGSGWTGTDKVQENTVNDYHVVMQDYTGSANQPQCVSVFAKPSERDWVHIDWYDFSGNFIEAYFNVNTGVKGSTVVTGAATVIDYGIQPWINGHYRIWLAIQSQADVNQGLEFGPATGDTVGSYVGTTGWGAEFIGAQAEVNKREPTSWIPTAGGAVTRGGDQLSYPSPGNIPNAGPCTIIFWANSNFLRNAQFFSTEDGSFVNGCSMFTGVYNGQMVATIKTAILQASLSSASDLLTVGGPFKKFALAYDVNDAEWYTSDVSRGTDGSVALPTNAARIAIGMDGVNLQQFNGHIKKVRIFNRRLSLSEIKLVT